MPDEGSNTSERPAVFDTTVLINFGQAGAFDILRQLYADRAVVVEEVIAETLNRRSRLALRRALRDKWIRSYTLETPEELRWLGTFLERLHIGEAASLAVAKVHQWRFASDDRVARKIAERELPPGSVFGSIGILVKAVEAAVCTVERADKLHAAMLAAGYRSPVLSIREILKV